jgi:hypothetical protein
MKRLVRLGRPGWRLAWAALAFWVGLLVAPAAGAPAGGRVQVLRTPDGGIQPQALLDGKGNLHVIYFKGDAEAGDLFYARREAGKERFAAPLRVNSQPGSAIAIGTIRGGQLALGKGGRVHVAWNGSGKARPVGPGRSSPMLYARLNDAGTAFEPQRNLMQASSLLDGGGSVAADDAGNVYVAWHAVPAGAKGGEAQRTVWLAWSADEGQTFGKEAAVLPRETGACGCCGLRAFADRQGRLFLLYRAATARVHRDMILLDSDNHGQRFREVLAHPWEIGTCPMSSEAFGEGPGGVRAAWETEGQIYFTRLGPKVAAAARPAPGAGGRRQHPALAVNDRGETLLAWTEGTGWQRGGALAWQVFDREGRPTGERGRLDGGIAVWGLPAAVAGPGGGFLILH